MIPRKYKAKSNKFKFLKKKKNPSETLLYRQLQFYRVTSHGSSHTKFIPNNAPTWQRTHLWLRFTLKKKKKKESSRNEELDTPSPSKMNSTRRNRRRVVNCYIGFFNGILLRVPRDRWNPLRELKFHAQQVEAPSSVEVYRQAFSRFAARIIDSRSIDLVTVHGRMEWTGTMGRKGEKWNGGCSKILLIYGPGKWKWSRAIIGFIERGFIIRVQIFEN